MTPTIPYATWSYLLAVGQDLLRDVVDTATSTLAGAPTTVAPTKSTERTQEKLEWIVAPIIGIRHVEGSRSGMDTGDQSDGQGQDQRVGLHLGGCQTECVKSPRERQVMEDEKRLLFKIQAIMIIWGIAGSLNFDKSIIPTISDSLFWSAAYYCTSGSNYYACHKCQSGMSYKDIMDVQSLSYQHLKGFPTQSEILKLTRELSQKMESMRKIRIFDLIHGQTLDDFDNLEFKFNLITIHPNETVMQDFAFHHFLQSAQYPGKESLEGIYYRVRNMLIQNAQSTRVLWRGRQHTVFEMDKETYCDSETIEYFNLLLLKMREMMFFMLTNDFSDQFREERLSRFKVQSESDQNNFDDQTTGLCKQPE
eukprot:maker-scaffold464_size163657-snap-gene-0.33 protein:Tk05277 transcript:maker-scaffold464_size163657-snap-gene-0.33-mRNA-1 annotation:"hypothetical protein OPIT5_20760"